MSDLLGSILKDMKPPPSTQTKESLKRKREMRKQEEFEKKKREEYIRDIEKQVGEFVRSLEKEFRFGAVDKPWRAIQHDIGETAGLFTMSCYNDDHEKYVLLIKKEHMPTDDDGFKRRKFGKFYQENYAKSRVAAASSSRHTETPPDPTAQLPLLKSSYHEKYKRILEKSSSGEIQTERKYWGLVPSHMVSDEPISIENSLQAIREKKRRKTQHPNTVSGLEEKEH